MASKDVGEDESDLRRKQASLYDAVAGRIGYEGFLTEQRPSKYRDTASTTAAPVPPEEVLFRRKGAPSRYVEDDVYSADRHLQAHQRLPDSDLLKSVHAYVADYYGTLCKESSALDFRSLDETALLAIGILLEEAAVHHLGTSGDLALVEQLNQNDGDRDDMYWYNGQSKRNVIQTMNARPSSALAKQIIRKQ